MDNILLEKRYALPKAPLTLFTREGIPGNGASFRQELSIRPRVFRKLKDMALRAHLVNNRNSPLWRGGNTHHQAQRAGHGGFQEEIWATVRKENKAIVMNIFQFKNYYLSSCSSISFFTCSMMPLWRLRIYSSDWTFSSIILRFFLGDIDLSITIFLGL